MRATLADDLGLPTERKETCVEEFDLAAWSWGSVLDGLQESGNVSGLKMVPGEADAAIKALIAGEVADLNDRFPLPLAIDVSIVSCDEASAFYGPQNRRIEICTELVADLGALWDAAP